MTTGPDPLLLSFLIDECYPSQLIGLLKGTIREIGVDLIPFPKSFKGMEDWEVVASIASTGSRGLISGDPNMIHVPRVIPAVIQTKVALVLVDALNHNPVKATGALLLDIGGIARTLRNEEGPAIFIVKHSAPEMIDPKSILVQRAERHDVKHRQLMDREKLTPEELRRYSRRLF